MILGSEGRPLWRPTNKWDETSLRRGYGLASGGRPSHVQGVGEGEATGVTMTVSILSRRQRCTLA
jgi:hypothetical protein